MYEAEAQWRDVDDYFVDTLVPEDDALVAARRRGRLTTMPSAEVAPNQGPTARAAGADVGRRARAGVRHPGRLQHGVAGARGRRPGARHDLRGGGTECLDRPRQDIAGDPRLEATALQTVGSKGWDGLTILRRVS